MLTNAALSWVTFAGRAGFAFITTALVARALGPAGRGEVSYVINLAGLLALVAGAGTAAALVRARAGHHWVAVRLQGASIVVGVIGGLTLGAAALALLPVVDRDDRWKLAVVIAVAIPLVVLTNLNHVASLVDRLGLVAWTSLAGVAIYAIGTAMTMWFGVITVGNNVLLWCISATLPLVFFAWPGRMLRWDRSVVLRDSRDLLGASIRSNFAAAAVLAIWRIDVVMVQAMRGYEELGLYVVAVGTAEIVLVLSIGVRSAVLPHQGLPDPERLADVMCRVTRIALVGVSLLAVAVAMVGPWGLAALFGAEYGQAYPALVLLLPGVVLLVLHYPLFDYVVSRGGMRSLTVMGFVGVALNVVLNLVLLDRYSYVAASLTSTLAYLVVFVWCLRRFIRLSNRSWRETLLMTGDDIRSIRRQFDRTRLRLRAVRSR